MPEINNLREKRFILVHGFRGFSPKLTASIVLGLRRGEHLYGGSMGWERLLTSWWPGKTLQTLAPSDLFPQSCLTS
jgi:hypothetical protein